MAEIKNTMTVLLEEFGKKAGEYALDEFEYNGLTIRQWANKITSGEYQPVRHGHWELDEIIGGMQDYKCSVCGGVISETFMMQYRFCPWCGAKMDGGEEDAEIY